MLSALFSHFVPASMYGGETVFPTLSKIDRTLWQCQDAGSAAGILDRSKTDLCARLRVRFPSPVAEALTLKILNLCLARYQLHARSASLQSRPFGIVVDPSNTCQLACPGCVHSIHAEPLKLFDWSNGTPTEDRLSKLMKLYGPYAIGVYFCNYGEPLLNLNTPKLIRLAKTYLIRTALSTSVSVRRFDAQAYVESGLDSMVLSIDGATQSIYERFRRHGDLDLVLSNVRKLVDAKRALGKRTPILSWNFLAFEHNAHEIPLAARLARKLGVNQFRVVNPFEVRWDDPEIRPALVRASVQRFDWLSMANRRDNWNPFPDNLDEGAISRAYDNPWNHEVARDSPTSSGHTCHWLYKNIVMDAVGRVLPCCGAPTPDMNLVFATFDDAGGDPFNSEEYRLARSWFSGHVPPSESAPPCSRCVWDQTRVSIGGPEIRRYFRTADAAYFDRRSLDILSDW